MRALAAAILTTAVPMIVGQRWISGPLVVRWSLGAVLGIVVLAIGGLLGGLAGSPVLGAGLTLVVGWVLGPRLRCEAGAQILSPLAARILLFIFGVGLALMIMSLFRPVASWDAWFTWSIKSKGLAVAGSFDAPVFLSRSYYWTSPSYPTLLPSWQALAYIVSGDLSIGWPLQFQQAWLWTAGAIALVTLCDADSRGGFLLPLAWIIAPLVVWQSMQGYADVPMALPLILGTLVLRTRLFDVRSHVVAGVLLAGAALTKAEGLPLVAAVLLCLLAMRKPTVTALLAPTIVLAAWLPWFVFTQRHGIASYMVSVPMVTALLLGNVPSHLPQVAWIMGSTIFSPLRWGLLVPACLITALIARRLDARLGLTTVLQLLLFLVVYDVAGSHQGGGLDHFMAKNVDRILITPLGILALSVGLGSRATSSPPVATPQV